MKKLIIILLSLFLFSCEKNIENEEKILTGSIETSSFSGGLEENYMHNRYKLDEEKFKEVDKIDFIGGINFELYGEKVKCLENEINYISKTYNFSNCIPKYYVAENEISPYLNKISEDSNLFTKGEIYEEINEKNKSTLDFRGNSILFRDINDLIILYGKKTFFKLEKSGNYYSIDMFDENKNYLRTALIMEKISKEEFLKNEKYFSVIFDKFELDNRRFLETMRILEK